MKDKYSLIIHFLINIILFYGTTFMTVDTGSGMFVLLILIPLILFINSLRFGMKAGFCLIYNIITILAFLPLVFILYTGGEIYILIYAIISLIGNFIGKLISK